jgi:hypothetical protein
MKGKKDAKIVIWMHLYNTLFIKVFLYEELSIARSTHLHGLNYNGQTDNFRWIYRTYRSQAVYCDVPYLAGWKCHDKRPVP